MRLKVALAQVRPRLGDLAWNLEQHLEAIGRAREAGAEVVVFPELGLTGYQLKDMVPVVAVRRDDARLARLAEASRGLAVLASGVEESGDFRYHVSAFCWEDGQLTHVHRKVYLPTYGMFDEGRYFAPGDRFRTFAMKGVPAGALLCEDAWHASAPYLLGAGGAQIQFIMAASPARGVQEAGLGSQESWDLVLEHTARFHACYVVFVNRVGYEDGVCYWGGSRLLDPEGREVARAPLLEPAVEMGEIDTDRIRRARMYMPLLRDERLGVTLAELERIRREGPGDRS